MDMHVYIDNTGRVVPVGELGNMRPGMKRADSEASQTTINTEARDVILDLFPNIPAKDLTQIITTAFQKVECPRLYVFCLTRCAGTT